MSVSRSKLTSSERVFLHGRVFKRNGKEYARVFGSRRVRGGREVLFNVSCQHGVLETANVARGCNWGPAIEMTYVRGNVLTYLKLPSFQDLKTNCRKAGSKSWTASGREKVMQSIANLKFRLSTGQILIGHTLQKYCKAWKETATACRYNFTWTETMHVVHDKKVREILRIRSSSPPLLVTSS